MDKEIIADLMRHRPQTSRDIYCRGYWDGAMMVLAHYDPDLFYKMWPEWVRQKKMLALEKPREVTKDDKRKICEDADGSSLQ